MITERWYKTVHRAELVDDTICLPVFYSSPYTAENRFLEPI